MAIDWIRKSKETKISVRNFVNGRWSDGGGKALEKHGPRDGKLLCEFGDGEKEDVDKAVAIARIAVEDRRWSDVPVARRKEILNNFAGLIDKNREELALLESLDVGKPITDAYEFDIPASSAAIRGAAENADKLNSKVYGVGHSSMTYQLRRPMGVVGGIVGWNFPLLLAASKIGPALATGNSLVLKPSELTSLTAARVAELALQAGVPEGVFNVIHGGPGVGVALAYHNDVDVISFTGSSATGKKLLIAAGESNMKRLILECGGKAPNIVFDDSPDLDAVADRVVQRAFWNQGEVCTASSRLLIQESIKDQFLKLVIEKSAALNPGDPLEPETKFGAVVSRGHMRKILGYIESGEEEGARIAYRSSAQIPNEDGFYIAPVIFDQVSPQQRIAQEEIFGPVLSVITFRDEAEAIEIANGTIYGLSAILWTTDLGRAHRVTQGIKAGWISVNATGNPSGGEGKMSIGGHKQSGLGVEGGIEGLEALTSSTAVQIFV